jgi:hypothetical protein
MSPSADQPGAEQVEPADPAEPGDASEPKAHRLDAVHGTILALLVVVVVIAGIAGFQRIRGPQASTKFCAGVGLMGPVASSPDAALAAWLQTDPTSGTPSDWARDDDGPSSASDVDYRLVVDRTGYHFVSVHASAVAGGWSIQGACVG